MRMVGEEGGKKSGGLRVGRRCGRGCGRGVVGVWQGKEEMKSQRKDLWEIFQHI